jgi:hypothetical protein
VAQGGGGGQREGREGEERKSDRAPKCNTEGGNKQQRGEGRGTERGEGVWEQGRQKVDKVPLHVPTGLTRPTRRRCASQRRKKQ